MKIGMRSSNKEEEIKCLNDLKKYSIENSYELEIIGHQSGFSTDEKSDLIEELVSAHEKIFDGSKPKIKSEHITVEAGLFKEKIKDLEIAIISPKIIGAHTTNERVEIKSIIECDMWLYKYITQVSK